MTSRNSFFNILREDRKRRTWTFVLFCLICFLMTAIFELNLEDSIHQIIYLKTEMMQQIEEMILEEWMPIHMMIGAAAACLYGFQGFGWLCKREKVDFYHSQPMKREKRFRVIYLNGWLMFEIPMLLHLLAASLLLGLRGFFGIEIAKIFLLDIMVSSIVFMLLYHTVLLGIMLTGNQVVAGMIASILFSFSFVCKELFELYFSTYFTTYVSNRTCAMEWMNYLSPLEQIYKLYEGIVREQATAWIGACLILLLMSAIGGIGAFFLYKKRPSEAAEQPIAYGWAGDLIRILVVILSGMLCGLLFSFSIANPVFWLYFGTILGVVLTHGILETIFHFDIKAAAGKKKQLLGSTILVLGIVTVFCFDLAGYDRYIPKKDQVKEASYYIEIGECEYSFQILTKEGVPKWIDQSQSGTVVETSMGEYEELDLENENPAAEMFRDDYQLMKSKTTDVEPILSFVSSYLAYQESPEESNQTVEFIVHYKMKSGRDVYRRYFLPTQFVEEYFTDIYETEQGKEVIYPYWNLSAKEISEVNVYSPFTGSQPLNLNKEEIEELIACYKKDIREQSLKELLNLTYIGEIDLTYVVNDTEYNEVNYDLTLYFGANYEHLNQFFKERNVFLSLPNENYTVNAATLYNQYSDTSDHPFWQGKEEVSLTKEQAEQLLPYIISDQYFSYQEETQYYNGCLTLKEEKTGELREVYFYIEEKNLPKEMQVGE